MTDITTTNSALPPAPSKMQQRRQQGISTADNFSAGVQESFPTISIRGRSWAFKYQGQVTQHNDSQGYPVPYLDVVLLDASRNLSRVFYLNMYENDALGRPDCWSVDDVKPDPAAPHKQSPTCGGCKQNVFGSKTTGAGKAGKACQTNRRVAVALPHDLEPKKVGPIMLRVPYKSLAPLKEYSAFLNAHGYDTNGCVTRMSFEPGEAYPKIKFAFHMALNDLGYESALELTADERTKRILSAAVETAIEEGIDEEAAGAVAQAAKVADAVTPPPPPAAPYAQAATPSPVQTQAAPPPAPPARTPPSAPSPLAGALQAAQAPPVPPPPIPQAPRAPSTMGGPMGQANVFTLPGVAPAGEAAPPQNDAKTPRGRNKKSESTNEKKEEKIVDAAPGLENILASMLPPA